MRDFLSVRPPSHRAPTLLRGHRTLWMRVGRVVFPRSIARGAELTRTVEPAQAVFTAFFHGLITAHHNPEPGMAAAAFGWESAVRGAEEAEVRALRGPGREAAI